MEHNGTAKLIFYDDRYAKGIETLWYIVLLHRGKIRASTFPSLYDNIINIETTNNFDRIYYLMK